jgi:citrate synthase
MAETGAPVISHGLEGVYIAESKICKVDGSAGRLYYRGYSIDLLANNSTYEEVCYLILYGRLPNRRELDAFRKKLIEARPLPGMVIDVIDEFARRQDPMDTLRSAVSALSAYDNDMNDSSEAANFDRSVNLVSKLAGIVATIGRCRNGGGYVEPDGTLTHAENLLYMLNGSRPSQKDAKLLDLMLILHAEHSSNASTFSTLVAGSTLADLYSAVTSGIAALKGPLHGGADEAALRMMRAIGSPDNTERYIEDALKGKQKIMGFGHRVYKTYDPRAMIIKQDLIALQENESQEVKALTAIALRAEKMMIDRLGKTHGIWPNIDFFAGPIYVSMGMPIEMFTPVFAASRIVGWCAHMMEYWQNNRIFRPLEYYSGPVDLEYVPLDRRK